MKDTFDGAEIRKIMKDKDIKVKDLAKKIGLHPNSLSSALNGNRGLGRSALISLLRELNLESLTDRVS